METMKIMEKKKSAKGPILGLILFFILGGGILTLALKMQKEPEVIGNKNDTQTQSLVDVDAAQNKKTDLNDLTYSIKEKTLKDTSNSKMKSNMKLPIISINNELIGSVNDEINKYYTDMYSSLKEKMASASSNYTYVVSYNSYDNIVNSKKILSVTIYERIQDDSLKKNTMNKINTYNIDLATKEKIAESDIVEEVFGKDYKTIIRDGIKNYVVSKKMMNESDFSYTYTGLKPFYVKDGVFHVIFNEGDLVNSKYGVIDIPISKTEE